jgi:hypothetical protein
LFCHGTVSRAASVRSRLLSVYGGPPLGPNARFYLGAQITERPLGALDLIIPRRVVVQWCDGA